MSKLILYGADFSPAVRACLLTFKALNLPFEYTQVNLMAGEHLSEEYLKKNPTHTIPTLEDDGHFIGDSHAIIAYLVGKYAKDDSLYPKDLLKRAAVDQRLYFESGVMFQGGLRNISAPLFLRNQTQISKHQIQAISDIYDFVEIFLKDTSYIAGDHLTIADFSIVANVTSLEAFFDLDRPKYPKITAWLKRLESLPYYQEANAKGAKQYVELVKSKGVTVVD